MPPAKRASVDDFYACLPEAARPHLAELRELGRSGAPQAAEELKWNQPAFVQDGVMLFMLQAFKAHCSLRFPLRIVGEHKAEIEFAGYESGEGFLKLPYKRPVPADLCLALIRHRVEEFEATGAKW